MSQYTFSRAPQIDVPRSVFRRNHSLKTTMDVDYLYPIFVDEVLPADTFEFSQHLFGRLTTPLTPLMDNLYLDTFYFAVPVRLVDKDFKKFMGERPFGDVRNDYTTPMLNTGSEGVDFGSLYDYMNIPPKVKNLEFLAWYARAYNLIWNEWFRDENLVPAAKIAGVAEDGTVGTESIDDYKLLKRGKRLDYFTGCLPWPQKGEAVRLSLGQSAPVVGTGAQLGFSSLSALAATSLTIYRSNTADNAIGLNPSFGNGTTIGVSTDPEKSGLKCLLNDATASTINQLREAFAVQHLLEAFARGGTRYIELLRSCFNVVSPDARQQRPEYLGGTSVPLVSTTVAQTSASTDASPLGNLASFVTMTSHASWKKSFTEHTIIIGLANIRADLSYQQGLPRMYSRRSKYDFYWPQLANLGEQAVLNKEIYAQGADVKDDDGNAVDDDVFGYQERWAEYRYHPNMITGLMRSDAPHSLDVWHLAQQFESLPKLNESFIQEAVPIDRVVAVTDEPSVLLWGDFNLKCARPLPLYSVPGLRRM